MQMKRAQLGTDRSHQRFGQISDSNLDVPISVTRLGKNSPLCLSFNFPGQMFEGLFSIWQNFDPTLVNCPSFGAHFNCCNWPKIKQIGMQSGHTGTNPFLPRQFVPSRS